MRKQTKGAAVERETLLRKFEAMLDEWACARTFGTLEIEVRDGVVVLIRKITTEKIESKVDNPHATYRR